MELQLTDTIKNRLECMLFVAGDPVPVTELARVFGCSSNEMLGLLRQMELDCREKERGTILLVTQETAQIVSNPLYAADIEELLQPEKTKSVSQSIMETLSVIAYRQPVTRADIEAVRGVRCEYAVSQLLKLGLIVQVGRKDVVGKPALFGTTDKFLRKFGLHDLEELPDFDRIASMELEQDQTENN